MCNMKLKVVIGALVAAGFLAVSPIQAADSTSASSTSITGASVSISGTGSAAAGAFDKSGARASSYVGGNGYYQHSSNSASAHSFGASWAAGTHSGSGYTDASAWEYSSAEAKAGDRRRRSHHNGNDE